MSENRPFAPIFQTTITPLQIVEDTYTLQTGETRPRIAIRAIAHFRQGDRELTVTASNNVCQELQPILKVGEAIEIACVWDNVRTENGKVLGCFLRSVGLARKSKAIERRADAQKASSAMQMAA